MSDLISKKEVMNIIQEELSLRCGHDADIALFSVKKKISELPTAFDTEKVIEQLIIIHDEGYCPSEDSLECVLNNSCSDCYREKIADIVKKGGVE